MRREYIFLVILLIIALLFRMPHLFDKELGTDEKLTIRNAQSFKHISSLFNINSVLVGDVNPPLFFIILGIPLWIFDSVVTLKIAVVLMGLLGILLFYFFSRLFLGEKKSLLITILYSFNPMQIILSQHLRAYVLLLSLFILSLYFLYKYIYFKEEKYLIYTILVYIVSMYVHYYSILFIGTGVFTILYNSYLKKIKIEKRLVYYILSFSLLIIPSLLLLKHQISVLFADKTKFIITPEIVPYPLYKMSVMIDYSSVMQSFSFIIILSPIIFLLALYGGFKLFKFDKSKSIFLFINFILPYAILSVAGFFTAVHSFRYLMFLLPLYIFFMGYGIISLKNLWLRYSVYGIIILGWLWIMLYYFSIVSIYHWNNYIAI